MRSERSPSLSTDQPSIRVHDATKHTANDD
jgi:hypothetical protein